MIKQCKLNVHIKANAKRSAIIGWHNGYLKIAIQAPPVDGKANQALINFLSDYFSIPKQHVQIIHGTSTSKKQVCLLVEDEKWLAQLPIEEKIHSISTHPSK